MKRAAVCIALGLVAAAACGGPSPMDGSSSHGTGSTGGGTGSRAITGVYLRHDAANVARTTPAAGVPIGIYLRPILFSGPVLADPPKPLRVVLTGANGSFTFPGLTRSRYFVAADDNHAYAIGRWAKPGDRVTLTGCTDCPRPM
jgi:hypothetical protein